MKHLDLCIVLHQLALKLDHISIVKVDLLYERSEIDHCAAPLRIREHRATVDLLLFATALLVMHHLLETFYVVNHPQVLVQLGAKSLLLHALRNLIHFQLSHEPLLVRRDRALRKVQRGKFASWADLRAPNMELGPPSCCCRKIVPAAIVPRKR